MATNERIKEMGILYVDPVMFVAMDYDDLW